MAVQECNEYMELNIKKLLDIGSKKHSKRFRDLLKALEPLADKDRYMRMYVEARRSGFKGRIANASASDKHLSLSGSERMSILGGAGSYERGSHVAVE